MVDSQKIQGFIEWSAMKTILKLRYFLGLADYYKHFIEVAAKNNSSFRSSKEELNIGMVSWLPMGLWEAKDKSSVGSYLWAAWFKKPFEVHINASDRVIGGVLVQKRTFDCF